MSRLFGGGEQQATEEKGDTVCDYYSSLIVISFHIFNVGPIHVFFSPFRVFCSTRRQQRFCRDFVKFIRIALTFLEALLQSSAVSVLYSSSTLAS